MYIILVLLLDIAILMIPELNFRTGLWIAISTNTLVAIIRYAVDDAVKQITKNKEPITSEMANTAMNNAMKRFNEERK